jgi:hypothetical protein
MISCEGRSNNFLYLEAISFEKSASNTAAVIRSV